MSAVSINQRLKQENGKLQANLGIAQCQSTCLACTRPWFNPSTVKMKTKCKMWKTHGSKHFSSQFSTYAKGDIYKAVYCSFTVTIKKWESILRSTNKGKPKQTMDTHKILCCTQRDAVCNGIDHYNILNEKNNTMTKTFTKLKK